MLSVTGICQFAWDDSNNGEAGYVIAWTPIVVAVFQMRITPYSVKIHPLEYLGTRGNTKY